jgi:myo-inositol-1(or 4)-monophosphatase
VNDLDVAITAARAGGAIVAEGFGRHTTTDFKGRNDPVTEVDRAAENAIAAVLAAERPGDGVIGEEGTNRRGGGRVWYVDPLDGTVNFVHRLPIVSVSIALYDGNDAVAGVVFDPIQDELFAAAPGRGATLNGVPIAVSATDATDRALGVTGFPYDHHQHPEAYVAPVAAVLRLVAGLRRLGSAALDLCYVACGRIDVGWEFELKPWDVAAGLLILREAGGAATTPDGRPMTPADRHHVYSNGILHEPIRDVIDRTMPAHLRP